MPKYIVLMNLTEQGAKNLKSAPDRVREAAKQTEALGGKMVGFYLTMGEYDYVAITEGPDDETALLQLAGLAQAGNVNTKTLKAFTLDEFEEIVKKLP